MAFEADAFEEQVEADPSLVPAARSKLLVEPGVLDVEEVQALLGGLSALLRSVRRRPDVCQRLCECLPEHGRTAR